MTSRSPHISRLRRVTRNAQLYVLLLPALVWLALFCYAPMYGVQIAFRHYNALKGFSGSEWAGLTYFRQFFSSAIFEQTLTNTVMVSVYSLLFGFPAPILFALLLNQVRSLRFKSFVQTVTYAPYFISVVVLVSILEVFLAPRGGFVNVLIAMAGGKPVQFMTRSEWFRRIFVISGIWQNMGFNAIIYLAALSSINPDLHEAAMIDGASQLRQIWHIDIPGILPMIIIMLILSVGNLMSVGYEKVYLMQKGSNLATSEVINTYVYKVGLQNAQFSFATAAGLFNSVVNFVLLVLTNGVSRRISGSGLF